VTGPKGEKRAVVGAAVKGGRNKKPAGTPAGKGKGTPAKPKVRVYIVMYIYMYIYVFYIYIYTYIYNKQKNVYAIYRVVGAAVKGGRNKKPAGTPAGKGKGTPVKPKVRISSVSW
jgi:hypothetical protein